MNAEDHISEGGQQGSRPQSQHPWLSRVYIVDDHRFFTFALTSLINCEADLSVCGSGSEQSAVIADVARLTPDLVVLDVNLSRGDGVAMAAALRQVARSMPILFVSSLQNPQFEIDSRWLEPCSFVEKTKDPADIIRGIRQTLAKFHLLQSQFPTNT
jgi:DNA-binding NarL/FixJ family response regulator